MDGRISNLSQVAHIRRYICTEGGEKGLEVIECDNGTIRFLLNVSKALDIMQLYHKGQNVSFLSKNAFTARETEFLNRFEGGMLYTCGLDSVGDRQGYALHGTFHNIPAQILRAECDENGICVEALIRDTALFGKNLVMRRKISCDIGGSSVTLEDTLKNCGFRAENYCLLYHINTGYPMLDAGDVIHADVRKIQSRTDWAEENKATVFEFGAPQANREECCYFLELNEGKISVENKHLQKLFTVEFSKDTLPCFVEWKSEACSDYALGFEPCTTVLDDGFMYKTIQPQEKIHFSVKLGIDSK